MYGDRADMRLYADLTELNLGFLTLITDPGACQAVSSLGLDVAIVDQLRRLSSTELEFIAGTPGLLACFASFPVRARHHVAEPPADRQSAHSSWRESARLYVTGLLTYVWQLEHGSVPSCALCAGFTASGFAPLAEFDFVRIRSSAELAVDQLRVRFARHPSFWIDLIRSARSGDEDFQALSRLTVIPLLLAEECSSR